MSGKKDNIYFEMFVEMSEISNQAVKKLKEVLHDFHPDKLGGTMKELHDIESAGDECKHKLMEKLAKEFITPIEREDIMALADELDDVTDAIEDILLKIYMYNIQMILPDALEFMQIIENCCKELTHVMKEFPNFKKSKTINDSIIEINHLEELGDKLYLDSVHALYVKKGDPLEITAWREVYSCFEKCCDTCEHVADVVADVIMKNT